MTQRSVVVKHIRPSCVRAQSSQFASLFTKVIDQAAIQGQTTQAVFIDLK